MWNCVSGDSASTWEISRAPLVYWSAWALDSEPAGATCEG